MHPYIDYPGSLQGAISSLVMRLGVFGQAIWAGVGLIATAALVYLAVANFYRPQNEKHRFSRIIESDGVFILLAGLTILALQLPNLALPGNLDENNHVITAANFTRNPREWFFATSGTIGPLTSIPLALIYLIGGSYNIATIRLFGLICCVIPSILFAFKTLANFFNPRISRILVLPAIVLWAYADGEPFRSFNSTHIPMMLISASAFLLSKLVVASSLSLRGVFFCGLLLGSVPYAKLQVLPLAAAVALVLIMHIFIRHQGNLARAAAALAAFVAGGLCFTLFLLWSLYRHHALEDFWQVNVEFCLAYMRSSYFTQFWSTRAIRFIRMLLSSRDDGMYFLAHFSASCAATYLILKSRASLNPRQRYSVGLSLMLAAAAAYGIMQPGRFYWHYNILLVTPALLLSGSLVGVALKRCEDNVPEGYLRLQRNIILVFITLGSIAPAACGIISGSRGVHHLNTHKLAYQKDSIAQKINEYARPNEEMVVIGVQKDVYYYLQTGLVQGSKFILSRFEYPQINYSYHARQLAEDIMRNKPKIVLDTLAKGPAGLYVKYEDYAQAYASLMAVVERLYTLVAEIDRVRIYVRKEKALNQR